MSADKRKPGDGRTPATLKVPATPTAAPAPQAAVVPPMFRRMDWLAFGITALAVFIGYFLTLAPEVTLEDSGELATGSFYAGVPHPPGYPLWTVYTWFFTLLPIGNVAHRVAFGVAISGALAAGMLAMITSRGSSMLIESIADFKGISRQIEGAICIVAGFVAGMLLAFNGYMWSQSVIVEVYPFSVLSLMAVFCSLLRWAYAPHQRRYAYLAWFFFGICFTNHQTLLMAAVGIEVVILAVQPKLGRDLMLGNSIVYIVGYVGLSMKVAGGFELSQIVGYLYHGIGWSSIIACVILTILTKKLGTEIVPVIAMFCLWVAGAAFYLYMPLTSMTNPPMNWGYARTVDGFVHALTRGQYEKANPTNFIEHPDRLLSQLGMYGAGAVDEFNLVTLLLAIVPFLFFFRMQRRERAWLIGLSAIWFCLAILLLIMLNPQPDRQSRELNRVFFTASYTVIAIFIGYGVTLTSAFMLTQYQRFRFWGLVGGAVAAVLAFFSLSSSADSFFNDIPGKGGLNWFFYSLAGLKEKEKYRTFFTEIGQAFAKDQYGLSIHACLLLLGITMAFIAVVILSRRRPRIVFALVLFALLPVHSIMSHWSDNEQRNHWFGYWFGHDMFTPPFTGPDGKLAYDAKLREQAMKGTNGHAVYPEMARDAILFGGTDPGRFCPTYMIFCDSFVPHSQQPEQDQNFDRRDVYLITQNALADGTYLNYIRAHYNRSAQFDPPFFQELLRGTNESTQNYTTNLAAQIAYQLLDKPFETYGAYVEKKRRAEGIYPLKEIYIPNGEDYSRCFGEYINDVSRRYNHDLNFPNERKQVRQGENIIPIDGGRITVTGNVAVMMINGLLTKVIFDRNPNNEFYVEESFALDWMYPYLTPFGVIMKINRQPLARLSDDELKRDHEFWSKYAERLIGNWLTYDTPMKDLADFVERVHLKRNFKDFNGDRKFIRDDVAQKSFSKLRSAIAGIYMWRYEQLINSPNPDAAEQQRMLKEADFAFRQAFAFCPYSPEVLYRYPPLLFSSRRFDEAIMLASAGLKLDPNNPSLANLVKQLVDGKTMNSQMMPSPTNLQSQTPLDQLERDLQENPTNIDTMKLVIGGYMQMNQQEKASRVMAQVLTNSKSDARAIQAAIQFFDAVKDYPRLEAALERSVQLEPNSPEGWYNLASIKAFLNKPNEAIPNLRRALEGSSARLARDPKANNLMANLKTNGVFNALRPLPEFQQLLVPK